MPRYLVTAKYSADGAKGLLAKGGTARREAVTGLLEQLGGSLESFDFAFGDVDAYVVVELPDNVSAAAVGLAVGASGLVAVTTTVLLTPEEIDAAAAKHADYQGPGR